MRILAFGAHPDDLEFFMGGSLLQHAAQGDEVILGIFSHGEELTRQGDSRNAPRVRARFREANAAAHVLGAHEITFLGYGGKAVRPTVDALRRTDAALRWYEPDVVYAPHAKSGVTAWQADHRAAGTLVQVAHREYGHPAALRLYGSYTPRTLVDITPHSDIVLQALAQHESQRPYLRWWMPLRRFQTRRLGKQLGVEHAEGFDAVTV